jgi:NhaC family Na+:H+ antiporter
LYLRSSWNSCCAFVAATLGVPTFSYLSFTVFSVASPLIAVAMAFAC